MSYIRIIDILIQTGTQTAMTLEITIGTEEPEPHREVPEHHIQIEEFTSPRIPHCIF